MKKKVVIVGGGFGGLNVAKSLAKANLDITLIDKTNHHLFQPLLYQVATAALSPGDIATPIRSILKKQKNVRVLLGEVVSINRELKKVKLHHGELDYDYLVLAPGTRHSYFNNPEWEKYAPGLKTIQDALQIRERVLLSFEMAERFYDERDIEPYLTFVVVGGGPTGVEMAGAIAEISKQTMLKDFRKINPLKTKIYLVEGQNRILSSYDEKLSIHARNDLIHLGVTPLIGQKVINITSEEITTDERTIRTKNIIWAAGNSASSILATLDTELDRFDRVMVKGDCTIPEDERIFIIGDAGNYRDIKGMSLPGVAQVAIQQGKYVSKIIKKSIPSEKRERFIYRDKGSMATIGRDKAICEIGRLKLTGFTAWAVWSFVHILFLINFRNKYKVMAEWIYNYLFQKRGIRLITNKTDL
ncbi:MAG: NAD(P)/FAD-dependent oxidoreductase [Bacteroidetes bacterium]|nr:NAD(P)/FAD-dependent oxidoreductase [Bacteroidota bacterium]